MVTRLNEVPGYTGDTPDQAQPETPVESVEVTPPASAGQGFTPQVSETETATVQAANLQPQPAQPIAPQIELEAIDETPRLEERRVEYRGIDSLIARRAQSNNTAPIKPPSRRITTSEGVYETGMGALSQSGRPTNSNWLRYTNTNAIRNKPISPELEKALSFLPELGVTMEVFSGGETEDRRASNSGRHLHGGAADVLFYMGDRRLDWSNEEDRPIFQEIVRRARANGVTGIGAGPGYMRQGAMHIGFGTEAVWGAGGRRANAPQWLVDAFYG